MIDGPFFSVISHWFCDSPKFGNGVQTDNLVPECYEVGRVIGNLLNDLDRCRPLFWTEECPIGDDRSGSSSDERTYILKLQSRDEDVPSLKGFAAELGDTKCTLETSDDLLSALGPLTRRT